MKMKELWKLSLRSMLAVGLAVMVMSAAGCGDDDDDDDDVNVVDTTPAAFTITPQTNVALGAQSTSAPITVTGINSPAPISVSGTGGTYSINGGTFNSAAGTVTNGQTVTVRHNASATNSTVTTTNLTIGGVTAPFITITAAPVGADATPAAFSFTPQTGAGVSTARTSLPVTITGIDTAVPIIVTNGSYSINGGAFTSNAGVVSSGQTVTIRHNAASANNTITTTTVNIGGVEVPFTSITAAPAGADTTPNAVSFAPQTGVALGAVTTSAPITIAGIDNPAPVTITGGTYSINGGTYTSNAGLVSNGQTITVRHNAAATNNAVTTTTLNVGGVAIPFTSTTLNGATDTTPTAFTFTPATGVALGAVTTSGPITVAGINAPAPISVTGGSYSIAGGPFLTTDGTVTNGQTVAVRHTASALNNTVTTTTLNIGGVTAPFTSTTIAAAGTDTTPNAFTFTPVTGVALGAVTTSAPITVAGINASAPISVTGGSYSINGGTYLTTPGTVTNGQTVTVRHTASAINNTATTTTLNIGGVTGAFTSTTLPAAGVNALAVYQTRAVNGTTVTCADCHRLGTLDTTPGGTESGSINGPDLADTTQMPLRFPNPGVAGHFGIILSAEEITALTALFQAQ